MSKLHTKGECFFVFCFFHASGPEQVIYGILALLPITALHVRDLLTYWRHHCLRRPRAVTQSRNAVYAKDKLTSSSFANFRFIDFDFDSLLPFAFIDFAFTHFRFIDSAFIHFRFAHFVFAHFRFAHFAFTHFRFAHFVFAHFVFARFRFAHFVFAHFVFAHFAFTGRERSINHQWNKINKALLVSPQVTQITITELNKMADFNVMANEDGKNNITSSSLWY